MSFSFSNGDFSIRRCGLLSCGFVVMIGCSGAWAQESLRASLAGEEAARAKREQLEFQTFNMEFGPIGMRASAGLEVEANDNVRAASTNAQADLIFRPQVGVATIWRVTERNALNFGLRVGYRKYLNDTEPSDLFIAPGSDLSFDLFVGDFNIEAHSRFSYSQEATSDPTASNVGTINRFENISGVRATWDLNEVVLTASYDHLIYDATDPEFSYLTHSSELGRISAALRLTPTVSAGLEIGGGITDYEEQVLNDNTHLAIGPFLEWPASEYTTVRLAVGYNTYFITTPGTTNTMDTAGATSGTYFDIRIRQRLNNVISHALSAGQEVQSGFASSTFEMFYVRHQITWRLFQKTGLTTSFSYEDIPQSSGINNEAIVRYGFGLVLRRSITQRTSASLGYQIYYKSSDVETHEYLQNQLVINLGYSF